MEKKEIKVTARALSRGKLVKKLKVLENLAKAHYAYKKKAKICDYPPTYLWIEPTNICNLRCVMCPQSSPKMGSQKKGMMDLNEFKKIVNEASSFVYEIELFFGGESLLHKDFFSMTKYAKSKGIRVVLHTNATLLDRKKAYQLLNSGVDVVSFSFDGYDKETYEKLRVNANFENTLNNITEFLNQKKVLKMKTPYTILQILESPNVTSLDKAEQESKKKKFLSNLNQRFDELFIARMHSWGGKISQIKEENSNLIYMPCRFPWFSISIRWDGTVVPCCGDLFNEYTLGNTHDESLINIWNNDKMRLLRDKLANEKYRNIKLCQKCGQLWIHPYSPKRFFPYGNMMLQVIINADSAYFYRRLTGLIRKLRIG
jgi:radical SAM protein with 4Fe4S-binding SPASM domain